MTDIEPAAAKRDWRPGAVFLGIAAAAAVLAIWAGLGDGSLRRVQAAGVLRVGYAVEPPYALVLPDGSISGESPEVAAEAARVLGLRVEWVKTDFERLIPELERDRFDVIAAGLFVTPQRAERVRFSLPTLRVRPGWLVASGNPKRLTDYRGVAAVAGVRVGVLAGSVEHGALRALGLGDDRLLELRDAGSARVAMEQGVVDAIALSLPTVRGMAAGSNGRLVALPADGGDVAPASQTALAFRAKDRRLQRAVDDVLANYIGSRRHLEMLVRFNLTGDDLPAPPAAPRDAGSR